MSDEQWSVRDLESLRLALAIVREFAPDISVGFAEFAAKLGRRFPEMNAVDRATHYTPEQPGLFNDQAKPSE